MTMARERLALTDHALISAMAGVFAVLLVTAAFHLGLTAQGAARLPVVAVLAAAAVWDLRSRRIPDWLTLPGLAWALAASLFPATWRPGDAALGTVVCGGMMLLLACLSRGAIGGGDTKLAAVIGAALGAHTGLGVLVIAHLSAALVALPLVLRRRSPIADMPLGPFLALSAILAFLLSRS